MSHFWLMTVRLGAFGRTSVPAAGVVLFPGRLVIILMVERLRSRPQHVMCSTVPPSAYFTVLLLIPLILVAYTNQNIVMPLLV